MGVQFSKAELKVHAGNIEHRCSFHINKRENEIRQLRKKVASLLDKQKDESARFEALTIQKYERWINAYRLLTLAGRCVKDNVGVIDKSQSCPAELEDPVSSIVFASDRFPEMKELAECTKQFHAKWGEEFLFAIKNTIRINPGLVKNLSDPNPTRTQTVQWLKTVAEEHGIDWEPRDDQDPELLGTMKPFPPEKPDGTPLEDGSSAPITPPPAEPKEIDLPPPAYEPPTTTAPVKKLSAMELRLQKQREKAAQQQQQVAPTPEPPAPVYQPPAPEPEPAPVVQQQPQRVAAYPALSPQQPQQQQQPQRVAAYPALAPQPVQQQPVAKPAVSPKPVQQPQQPTPTAAISPKPAPAALPAKVVQPTQQPTPVAPQPSPKPQQQQQVQPAAPQIQPPKNQQVQSLVPKTPSAAQASLVPQKPQSLQPQKPQSMQPQPVQQPKPATQAPTPQPAVAKPVAVPAYDDDDDFPVEAPTAAAKPTTVAPKPTPAAQPPAYDDDDDFPVEAAVQTKPAATAAAPPSYDDDDDFPVEK